MSQTQITHKSKHNPLTDNEIKIPERGKYTLFQDFKVHNEQKSKQLRQTQMRSHSVEPMKTTEMDFIKNPYVQQPKKMDNFLKYSNYGSVSYNNQQSMHTKTSSSQIQSSRDSRKSNNSNSYYFNGPERFNIRNLGKTNFDQFYNELNHMVSEQTLDNSKFPMDWKNKNYDIQQHQQNTLNTTGNIHKVSAKSELPAPHVRRKELKHLLDELKQQKEEIKQNQLKIKRSYLINTAYRSGVMSIDNPENPNSKLYNSISKKLQKENEQKIKNQDLRKYILQNNRSASKQIQFYNTIDTEQEQKDQFKQEKLRTNSLLRQSAERNVADLNKIYKEREQNSYHEFHFQNKRKIKGEFMDKFSESGIRLSFDPKKLSQKIGENKTIEKQISNDQVLVSNTRRCNLVYQDKRGKSFDIISPTRVY